jgi:N-acetylglucosaminyl-diphospho-decaprenol L-rhamnosyltransferase
MTTLAAVLVNYNSDGELTRALESIDREAGGRWEGVVIDNASIDGSERAALDFPAVRLLQNRENVGFGRGVNQAIAATTSDYVLVMNPDCQLSAGALTPLIAVLDADATRAVAAPQILDPDGTPQGNARGDPDMLTGLFGRTSPLRRTLSGLSVARRNVVPATAHDAATTVDWVSGACMLVRRSAVMAVGGFDERYFMYWEDADLCRRLRQHGFVVCYVPAVTAVHRVGQSSRTARAASIRAFHDSAYLYYSTHVASGALNPKRWMARVLLTARCWWKLRTGVTDQGPGIRNTSS